MVSLFNRYAVSRSDSISRQSSIGTMTAVGSPLSLETIWISEFATSLVYNPEAAPELARSARLLLPLLH